MIPYIFQMILNFPTFLNDRNFKCIEFRQQIKSLNLNISQANKLYVSSCQLPNFVTFDFTCAKREIILENRIYFCDSCKTFVLLQYDLQLKKWKKPTNYCFDHFSCGQFELILLKYSVIGTKHESKRKENNRKRKYFQ